MNWFVTFPKTRASTSRLLGTIIIAPWSCQTAIYRTVGDGFAREWIEQNNTVISFPTKIPTVSSAVSQCFLAGRLEMGTSVPLPKRRVIHVEIQPSPSPWSFWSAKTQGQGGPGNVGPSASCRRS
ncbi:hypothetical protein RHGRI_001537 [Rhododendron griersonianum]|uniref:Uncharacterized protein n=1 Tax=Rhododendron griersonianum TaxID=479676 RepID=A0AAV6LN30_9ERIC|nr:hypothetical protein RHGRI_001537 [Rhododendron griersonianum]